MTAVLYAPLRWRQAALILETPCCECMIRNIHKSIWQTILFSIFSSDTPWAGQPAIIYQRKNEKLKSGFSINWETHLHFSIWFFKMPCEFLCFWNDNFQNTLEFCAQCLMYSYSMPLRIQLWVLFYSCSSLSFLFVCPHVSWALVFGEHLS